MCSVVGSEFGFDGEFLPALFLGFRVHESAYPLPDMRAEAHTVPRIQTLEQTGGKAADIAARRTTRSTTLTFF